MKVKAYSKLLATIAAEGLLKEPEIKSVIKHCIRTVTETNDYHCSVNYRSQDVANETETKGITSKSLYHQYCSKNFRHEHIVPCEVQYELLINLPDLSEENIKEFFKSYSLRATITRQEDGRLNDAGFKSKMPEAFYKETQGKECYFQNPLARYLASELEESLQEFDPTQYFHR